MQTDQRLANIDAEIARVELDIKAQEKRLHDLTALKLLLTEYSDVVGVGLVPIRMTAAVVGQRLIKPAKPMTKQAAIIENCRQILADGKRRFSRDLLPELEKRGVKVGGRSFKVEKRNLAAYLSRSDLFESNVKLGGWTLRSLVAHKAKASNAPTLPAFSTNGASPEAHQLAGSPREGGFQFD